MSEVASSTARGRAPIHVLHVVSLLGHRGRTGGMEYGVIKLAHGLDRRRITTSVCSSYEPDPAIAALLPPDTPRFHCGRRPGHDVMWVLRLTQLLRRERPDVVHTHAWGTLVEGLLAARLARVPHVVHGEHGTMWTQPRQVWLQRWAWSHVGRVLSVSSSLATRMAEAIGFPEERIHVIRNGVDLERFTPANRGDGRARLGLSDDDVCIGTVGRFTPVKDQANLIEALAHVRDAGVRFRAVIAGDGPLRGELDAQCERLGLTQPVQFLGHRHDVEFVLAAMDVFVLPSKSEGLSNTIQEALGCGVPVVATDVGGARELIDEGRHGFLVPREDPQALGRAIGVLVADAGLRAGMGRENRRRAEAEFGLDTMLRGYTDLYESLGRERRLGARRGLE